MTRILGLDLSLTATGICTVEGSTFTVSTRAAEGDRRLTTIGDAINHALVTTPVALAVIEDLPTHAHSAGITGMVHGVARLTLMRRGVPYALVAPATLKAFATGKGNATKSEMAVAAFRRGGETFGGDDNQCDAWWLRQAGLHHLGAPEAIPLPKAQVARLDRVTWPDNLPIATEKP